MQKLHLAVKSQQHENDRGKSPTVGRAADCELSDDAVRVPRLSVLAELECDSGEGLLDEDRDETDDM